MIRKAADITKAFLMIWDGQLVWIRDDYLAMRGYAEGEGLRVLDRVALLKEEMREEGYIFSA